MIIAIAGKARHGKTTLAREIKNILENEYNVDVGLESFASKIKEVYRDLTGLTEEEINQDKESHRRFLQELGKWGRKISPRLWTRHIETFYTVTIIDDFRFEVGEGEWLDEQGAYKVYISCPDQKEIPASNDESENGIHWLHKFHQVETVYLGDFIGLRRVAQDIIENSGILNKES